MARHTYPGMIYVGASSGSRYVPAALVDELVETLIACRDNYGKRGGLINDPNAPGVLIDKIRAALEKAGVTG